MPSLHTAKKLIVMAALGMALRAGAPSFAATTTSANAADMASLHAVQLINKATNVNLSANSPAGQAAAAAAETAKSPEMQKAVVSVWATAWQAAWPFLKSMLSGFFGLFVTAWRSATAPALANVNTPSNANASPTPR